MALISWKGGAGGNGDWNTKKDWSSGTVPTATDSVQFALGGAYTVTGDGSVAALTVLGDATTFDGAINVSGILAADSGADVTIDPNALFTVGTLAVDANSLVEVQGVLLDGAAVAQGAVLVDGIGASWATSGTAEVSQLQVFDGGAVAGNVQLDNFGSIKLDATAQFGGAGSTLTLAGNGSLYMAANAGATPLGIAEAIALGTAGTGLFLGSDPGTELNISGAIGGAGYVLVNAGTVELGGVSSYTGGTVVDGATLIVDNAAGAGAGPVYLADSALTDNAAQDGRTIVAASGNDTIAGAGGGMVVWAAAGATLNFTGGAAGSEVIGNTGASLGGTLNVSGGTGADTISGYNEAVVNFTGGSVGDKVYGGAGVLHAVGGSGGDTIFAGTSGQDVLQTGSGPTTLAGGTAGGLLIATGSAANVLAAGGGNTTLAGGTATGDNVFFGAVSGNTTIEGGAGTDTIVGLGGADTVYGGTGTENVFAGSGSLQLDFVTTFGGGSTDVQGFNVGLDRIHLSGFAADAVQQTLASEKIVGGTTVLTLPDNTTLVFWNTTGITAANFV